MERKESKSEIEVLFLDTWLKDNPEILNDWPANIIASRIEAILADGIIMKEEAEDLQETLAQIVGGNIEETGVAGGLSTQLPVDPNPAIEIPDRTFVFTGKFIYGPRSKCQKAIIELGGSVAKNISKSLDYLVIGALASTDWKYTSHGRKIEKAVKYRDSGCRIVIVAEQDWVDKIEG